MLLALHLLSTESSSAPDFRSLIFHTPLYFGVAHLHHAYEFRLTHPGIPILPVILRTLFQFTYTSLFGFYAVFLFLRTGSLWNAVLAHTFCNWMGLPRIWGRIEHADAVAGSVVREGVIGPAGQGNEDELTSNAVHTADERLNIWWTVAYYLLLFGGAWEFYLNLYPLTLSEHALVGGW